MRVQKRLKQNKIDAARNNPNPEVPFKSGAWGGMAGDDPSTLGWLAGVGMYSLIVGMFKSKVVRVVAPIVILGFIVLGYLLFKQYNAIFSSRF